MSMTKTIITKADIDAQGFYKSDSLEADGHIEIEAGLGVVRFRGDLKAKGYIRAIDGSGISAGGDISAGEGISAGLGISAGSGISAGLGISAGWGISAGSGISAEKGISAGSGISAGEGISAGLGIFAGWGISAGEGISAGWGISAGEGISAKGVIKAKLRIFAGLVEGRLPTPEEMEVRCLRLEGGAVVAHGTLIEACPARAC